MKSNLRNSFELLTFISARALVFGAPGCKENNPAAPGQGNEQELITKVLLTLTENGTGNVATFNDPDGGAAPAIGALTIKAGSVYTGAVSLTDEGIV